MLSPDAVATIADEVLSLAKSMHKSSQKLDKMRTQKLEDLDRAKALQEEASAISQAKLDGVLTEEMRDLTKVHREVLKAHNRVDKAIDKANEAEEELSEHYRALRTLLENGASEPGIEPDAPPTGEADEAVGPDQESLHGSLQEETS